FSATKASAPCSISAGGRFRRLWTGSFEDELRRTPRQKRLLRQFGLLPYLHESFYPRLPLSFCFQQTLSRSY
ncbi:MAG: hypothetical protein IIV05_09255, partial [Ruminococcus sp.]|nr:hypothetical protein [Ruminococcus sp.]